MRSTDSLDDLDETGHGGRELSRPRVIGHAVAMTLLGVLEIGLGAVGLWNYAERGFVLSRSGERMQDAWVWIHGVYALVGVALIVHAVRFYRRERPSAG